MNGYNHGGIKQNYLTFNNTRVRDKMADIFQTTYLKSIFLNENVWILIKISLKCVPEGPINNNQAMV